MSWGHRLVTVLLGTLLASCSTRASGETDAEACSDGRDNDGDGLVDCLDPACNVYAWCSGTGDDGGTNDAGAVAGDGGPDGGPRPDAAPSCGDPIDVVFVIDVSTSMADEVEQVRMGMDQIWAAANALTSNTQFGLVVFVDDVAVVNGCAAFGTLDAMRTEFARWRDFTSSNGQPGGSPDDNSDCAENSLDALFAAATSCPWRAGATHIAIHVTDDTFEERPAILSSLFGLGGIPVQHTYAETVAALVASQVRVGAFAAPGAGEFCGAGTSANVGRGFHEPFSGMDSVPAATGGRAWSIREVRAGTLDMAEAIAEFTADEYCTLF